MLRQGTSQSRPPAEAPIKGVGSPAHGSAGITLNLVLTHHWYDETEAGRKRVEYRSMTTPEGKPSKWVGQLWNRRHRIKRVRFSRGYTMETQLFDVGKIDIGPCPIPGWSGDFYRIHFSEPNAQDQPRRNPDSK